MHPLSTPRAMDEIVPPLVFFYKNAFGFKHATKVDMPLNKETKSVRIRYLEYDDNPLQGSKTLPPPPKKRVS